MLTIALHAEGSTDYKFYKPLIRRTIEDIVLNTDCDIELYPILDIKRGNGSYKNDIVNASIQTDSAGFKCLIIHCDADSHSKENVLKTKINPAIAATKDYQGDQKICKNIIPLIPVYMTEAWMLADITLLKSEINASNIDDSALGFTKTPEKYSDPKKIIREAISKASLRTSKRRRTFNITELYSPIGNKIDIEALKSLPSYQDFYNDLKMICLPYCSR